MGTLILQEGETVKLQLKAQLAKGYPQTVGDLILTDRRLILMPNQLLSVGFGKRWEINIADIQNLEVKNLMQGGPFVGSLGNRLEITLKDNSRHLLSALSDITPLVNALSAQVPGKAVTQEAAAPQPAPQAEPASQPAPQSEPAPQPAPQSEPAPQPVTQAAQPVEEVATPQPAPQSEPAPQPVTQAAQPVEEVAVPQSTSPTASASQANVNPPPPPQGTAPAGTYYPSGQAESFFDKIKFKSAPSNVVCENPNCRSFNTVNVRKNTLNWGIWLLVVGFPVGLIFFVIPGALAMVAGMFNIAYSFFIPSNNWKCKTCKYQWKS